MKKFEELTEREVLALAIALEEEDERVYADFAEGLRQDYPATASMFDDKAVTRQHGDSGGWGSSYAHTQEAYRTIVSSAVDDTSESKAKTKAQLSGEVKVNLRSDVFSLDNLANQTEIDSVNERAQQ